MGVEKVILEVTMKHWHHAFDLQNYNSTTHIPFFFKISYMLLYKTHHQPIKTHTNARTHPCPYDSNTYIDAQRSGMPLISRTEEVAVYSDRSYKKFEQVKLTTMLC